MNFWAGFWLAILLGLLFGLGVLLGQSIGEPDDDNSKASAKNGTNVPGESEDKANG